MGLVPQTDSLDYAKNIRYRFIETAIYEFNALLRVYCPILENFKLNLH